LVDSVHGDGVPFRDDGEHEAVDVDSVGWSEVSVGGKPVGRFFLQGEVAPHLHWDHLKDSCPKRVELDRDLGDNEGLDVLLHKVRGQW